MSVMYLMLVSLGRLSFRAAHMCTGLIITLLSLAGYRHSCTVPFALGTKTKLLHYSDVSFTAKGTIISCFYNNSNSPPSDSKSTYATLFARIQYGWLPSLTCNLNVPSKHPVPGNTSPICYGSLCN